MPDFVDTPAPLMTRIRPEGEERKKDINAGMDIVICVIRVLQAIL
jgi:hypothetical protein